MNTSERDVVIVGGGISGLTAAWRLKEAGIDVCLLERAGNVGGCTRTERREGFLLEKGPFNVIVRDPAFEKLLVDLEADVKVVPAAPAAKKRYIYHRGTLHVVPTNPVALMATSLLSVGARCRLLAGLLWSGRARGEETIEQAAVRRFGRQTADTIVSAAIAGIFAGDIAKLSLTACFPSVGHVDEQARSLIGYGLRSAVRRKGPRRRRRWPGLVSIDGGLGAVCESLARRLGDDLLRDARVTAVEAAASGFEIRYDAADPARSACNALQIIQCQRVVLASPAAETARLLATLSPDAAAELSDIESGSLAVLNLGFRSGDVHHSLDGFGFLVPPGEPDFPLMGVLWADSVFPHHAPTDRRLLRVFVGGPRHAAILDRTDEQLLGIAVGAVRELLDIRGDPVLSDVCRYSEAIPQYHVGHGRRITRIRRAMDAIPGLHLIGNYLEGVSLNDCVRLATRVADELATESRPAGEHESVCEEGHERLSRVHNAPVSETGASLRV